MPRIAEVLPAITVGRLKEPGDHAVGGVAGLMLRVTPTGGRSWVLRTRVAGKRPEYGLGPFPAVKLAEARELAAAALAALKKGITPADTKAEVRAKLTKGQAESETFSEAAARFIAENRSGWRSDKHAKQWSSTLTTHVGPTLGNIPVGLITVKMVLTVLRPLWQTMPETAGRLRQRIEKVIAAADIEADRERPNPARAVAIHAVLKPRKVSRTVEHMPSLHYKEMAGFMLKLNKAPGLGARALAWSIMTGARSGMTRHMVWGDLNMAEMIWLVPADRMKTEKEWCTPILPEMLALLPAPGKSTDYVFPGTRTGKPLSDMTLSRTLERMGVDAVPHGFRATFKSWAAAETRHDPFAVEKQLAHSDTALGEAYQRDPLLDKRRPLLRDWMTHISGDKPAASAAKPATSALRLAG